MPQIIRTIDEIMDQGNQDGFFVNFDELMFQSDEGAVNRAKHAHFEWFERHGLTTEPAAPRGWLSGHPGCYAVFFDGHDDPLIAAYMQRFEDHTGSSLDPNSYQMFQFSYQDWINWGGAARLVHTDKDI